MGDELKVLTLVPCRWTYPTLEHGIIRKVTCIGLFDALRVFDFPSSPQDISIIIITKVKKGSYKIDVKILEENGCEISSVHESLNSKDDNYYNLDLTFQDIVFNETGIYKIQLIVDGAIIYEYDFEVMKIEMRSYTCEEIKKLNENPETAKLVRIDVTCSKCGRKKYFSKTLDPEKQKVDELPPDDGIYKCICGEETNISDIISKANFYLGRRILSDTFDINLEERRKLATTGFLNAALIMQVTAFEAMMRDYFVLNYKHWFVHLINDDKDIDLKEIKREIIKTLKDMKLKEEFQEEIFLLRKSNYERELDEINAYNKIIKNIVFGDDDDGSNRSTKMISFQQLNGEFGCFWAYKRFLGIDLKKILDKKGNKGNKYTKQLSNNFQIRHRIIHGSSWASIKQNEISPEILQQNEIMIRFIQKYILSEFEKLSGKTKRFEKEFPRNDEAENGRR